MNLSEVHSSTDKFAFFLLVIEVGTALCQRGSTSLWSARHWRGGDGRGKPEVDTV